ncbi:MAG: AAA family ATPase [Cyanobacteria bacterium P01_A01_bin.123]
MGLSYPTELLADFWAAVAAVQVMAEPLSCPSKATSVPLACLIGLPGSGKSTWAIALTQQAPRWQIISTDQIRAQCYGDELIQGDWITIWRQAQRQFRQGIGQIQAGLCQGVIYDATNVRRRHRRQFLRQARGWGFDPIIGVWLDLPLAVCLSRNQQRSRCVPEPVILRMHRQLDGAPPSLGEPMDHLVRVRGD